MFGITSLKDQIQREGGRERERDIRTETNKKVDWKRENDRETETEIKKRKEAGGYMKIGS